MRLYRICHVDHLENYRGLGASYHAGGRWNQSGIPVLYFAETASVAMLEMANYLPSPRLVPPTWRLGVYEVAGNPSLERWTVEDVPADWDRFPHPPSTQRMGSDWLRQGSASLLVVPSAAVPGGLDNIVLASPTRLDAASIRLTAVRERLYNPRAFGDRWCMSPRGRRSRPHASSAYSTAFAHAGESGARQQGVVEASRHLARRKPGGIASRPARVYPAIGNSISSGRQEVRA